MNKVRPSWGKNSLVTVLSLGFMLLGIGCIFWAVFSMGAKSDNSSDVTRSHDSITTTFAPSPILSALDKPLYPVRPAEGDNIGSLSIPALKRKLPILEGTGVKELEKGVGHFTQSALPGEKDNCVFSGHRETVFRQIGNLEIGDHLIVQTVAGTFTYEVNEKRIVHEDDKTVIVPTYHAVLTMTTCYPFYTPGYSPYRYIVSAILVKNK